MLGTQRSRSRSSSGSSAKTIFDIVMLPAETGDCLWIEYGDPQQPRRILIDCGAVATATLLATRIEQLREHGAAPLFELFVLTHIDADHINGVLPLFQHDTVAGGFQDIWFNGWKQINPFLGVKQAEAFSALLADPTRGLPWNRRFGADGRSRQVPRPVVIEAGQPLPAFELEGGLRLTLLSPGERQLKRLGQKWGEALEEIRRKEEMLGRKARPPAVINFDRFDVEALANAPEKPDRSAPNGSSIAMLAEFDGRSMLLTGDAYPDVIVASLRALQRERGRPDGERLPVDALKLSHHGSANATTGALLNAIDCQRFLVSTNGKIHYHPDRETIARILVTRRGDEPSLFFNYRSAYNEIWEHPTLQARFSYQTSYPKDGELGIRLPL